MLIANKCKFLEIPQTVLWFGNKPQQHLIDIACLLYRQNWKETQHRFIIARDKLIFWAFLFMSYSYIFIDA